MAGDFDDFPGMKELEENVEDKKGGEEDDGLEIEIVDDTPPEDRGRSARSGDPDIPDDDEISSYSEKVQKRIHGLKAEYHAERRQREEAERVRQASVEYAKSVQQQLEQIRRENESLKNTLHDGEDVLVEQARERVKSQLEAAQNAYKKAFEEGDSDALVTAQTKIAQLAGESQYIESQARSFRQRQLQQPPPQQQVQQPPPQAPQLNDLERKWFDDNKDWFNVDKRMTGFAYGVHEELASSGVKPGSARYYEELNKELRKAFPDKFEDDDDGSERREPRSRATTVAAPSRSGSKKHRKITLSRSQVEVATQLGLTPQQYAAELVKLNAQQEA